MVAVLHTGVRNTTSLAASATVYTVLEEGFVGNHNTTTESLAQVKTETPGTWSDLAINVFSNDRGASTYTFRKGGANGNQSVSVGASSTGIFADTTHADTVAAGDLVNAQLAVGTGGTTFVALTVAAVFSANSGKAVKRFGISPNTAISTASSTMFEPLAGNTYTNTSEAQFQFQSKLSGTLQNLFVNINANTWTTATSFGTRVGGANGTVGVSVGASTTGTFEDTTHTDSVSVGSLVDLYITTGGGTGSLTAGAYTVELSTTGGQYHQIAGAANPVAFNANITNYIPVGGYLFQAASTESEVQQQLQSGVSMACSDLECYVSANTVTATSTLRTRKNGANGNQSISIASSTTGYFEDTVDGDSYAPSDKLNYQMATGATGTSLSMTLIGMLAGPVASDSATVTDSASNVGLNASDSGTESEQVSSLSSSTAASDAVAEAESILGIASNTSDSATVTEATAITVPISAGPDPATESEQVSSLTSATGATDVDVEAEAATSTSATAAGPDAAALTEQIADALNASDSGAALTDAASVSQSSQSSIAEKAFIATARTWTFIATARTFNLVARAL